MRRIISHPPTKLVLTYGTISVLWIFFSDRLLAAILRAPDRVTAAQTYKGWAFVAATSWLLYVMVNGALRERRREEEHLQMMRSAIEHTDEGIMIATAEFTGAGPRIVMANPASLRLFDVDAGDAMGGHGAELIRSEMAATTLRAAHEALQAGRTGFGDFRFQRRDGTDGMIEWTAAPVRNSNGQTTHFLAVTRDVTERRQSQEELERYRLMSDSTNTGVLFFSPVSGRILYANAPVLSTYGYSREELNEIPAWQLRQNGTRPAELDELLTRGGGRFEAVHRRKDGSTFPCVVTLTMTRGDGEPVALMVVQDTSSLQKLHSMQELLHEVDHRILQKEGLDEILQFACEQVVSLFGYRMAYIGMKEADGTVRCAATAGEGTIRLEGLKVVWGPEPNGPTGRAIFSGQAQLAPLNPDPRGEGRPDLAHLWGPWVCLSLPLAAKGQIIGALSLYAMDGRAFDEETQQHLRQFANQVALSILAARDSEEITVQTAALQAAANAILIADVDGRARWVNQAWTQMTGYCADEIIGEVQEPLTLDMALGAERSTDWSALLAAGPWHTAREARRKDGTPFFLEQTVTPVRDAEGRITHIISIAQDVTERRQQEEHLRFLALHDPLTGLPNRRALQEGLEQLIARSGRQRRGAMILLDLDHFKVVNDTLGDRGGDDLLIALTRLLQHSLRSGDLLTRFGGDQFAVLVGPMTADAARGRAESLRQAVSELRFQQDDLTISVSASVGVAMIDGSLDASAVKALANAALVAAKETGRNQVAVYESEWDKPTDLAEQNRLAAMVKEALRENRLRLHFQPIVHLATGAVDHYEALIRLEQPDGTLLPPGAFLGAAERFRLMPAIDRWVLDSVLTLLRERPNLHLFVNLSGQSLSDESLRAYTENRLRASGDLAARLSFEVTETAAVRDMERVKLWMNQMKVLGCRFALDDFGIGFSSFAYLRVLPADCVKIDGSFIRNLDTDPTNRSLVQAMYTAAQTLGKVVVAEWVENESIAQVLREVGVEYGQGYRWGKPSPALPPP